MSPAPTRAESPLQRGSVVWIRADRLHVDERYERPLSKAKVRKIVRGFDPDAFGVLYVAKRPDGSYVILDGMHRHRSVLDMGWHDQMVPCFVYEGLSLADEARLFGEYNELRTRPRPLDLHRAAVVAEDGRALAIERVLASLDLHLSAGPGLGAVNSVQACRQIYDNASQSVLRETLQIATRAWGQESTSYNGEVLVAIAAILARHAGDVDRDRLVRALHRSDPKQLLSKARAIKSEMATGGAVMRVSSVLASLIVTNYNYRLAEAKRLSWDMQRTGGKFWTPLHRDEELASRRRRAS